MTSPTSRPSSSGRPSSASSSTTRRSSRRPANGGWTGPSASTRSAPTSSPAGTRSRSRPGRSRSTASSSPSISSGPSASPPRPAASRSCRPRPSQPGPGTPRAGRSTGPGSATRRPSPSLRAAPGPPYRLRLGAWLGATAEVFVGEKHVGTAAFPPYECDLTGALAPGPNAVSVVVYGTLRNTLGPLHNDPPLGRAWPGSFQQGAKGGLPPGSEYSSVGYGLFDDFKIMKGTAR